MSAHCNLAEAFPEHVEHIRKLEQTSQRFQHLAAEYKKINHELSHLEIATDSPDEGYIERLKKMRLAVKEEVVYLLADAE